MIRKMKEGKDYMDFIEELSSHIRSKPFVDIVIDYNNSKIITWRGERYQISDWLSGTKIDFSDKDKVSSMTRTIAKLYNLVDNMGEASTNIIPKSDVSGNLIRMYNELLKFSKNAKEKEVKGPFDLLFMSHIELVLNSISRQYINLLYNPIGEVMLTDYRLSVNLFKDYMVAFKDDLTLEILHLYNLEYEIPMKQLANIIIKHFKEMKEPLRDLRDNIISVYNKERKITEVDKSVLDMYLGIPNEFWKASRDYYEEKNLTETKEIRYLEKLKLAINLFNEVSK